MPAAMLDLATLREAYASGGLTPFALIDLVCDRIEAAPDQAIFISRFSRAALKAAVEDLLGRAPVPGSLPLWGVPFAVKDNIDVVGLDTTAACPDFAYRPERDATCVARLKAAGAIVIGKTNLDQFATGLNGTRSPYGAPRCVFDERYISGGSSSGSAVAVARGLVSFALGTDTAGSGRVPAAFNNIVGIKPTPGRVSTTGLVPACRSLDVITVFAGCVSDGVAVRAMMEGEDASDPFSRPIGRGALPRKPKIGVPREDQREFYGDAQAASLYEASIRRLTDLGFETVPFDYQPFLDAALLLYEGPWVAERLAALESFHAAHADSMDASVRAIVAGGARYSAVDAFKGIYKLEALKQRVAATWREIDVLMLPTSPTTYTVEAMMADPIRLNSHLGRYTNFANLMGLAAIAVPAGFGDNGLPFGVTLVGGPHTDDTLAPLAAKLHEAAGSGMGVERTRQPPPVSPTASGIPVAVVGAHLSGMPLNKELLALGASFVAAARTAPSYRLYRLPGTVPPKPGLVRVAEGGAEIELEVWDLTAEAFGRFVGAIPAPLGIGQIELSDGTRVHGFLCEAYAVASAEDISRFGGWRAFIASL